MIGSCNFQKFNFFVRSLFPGNVVSAEFGWHNIVGNPVNENLPGFRNVKPHRIGVLVMIRNVVRLTAEEFNDGVVAEMEVEGALKVNDAGQGNHALNRGLVTSKAKGKLCARGMAHNDDSAEIQ